MSRVVNLNLRAAIGEVGYHGLAMPDRSMHNEATRMIFDFAATAWAVKERAA